MVEPRWDVAHSPSRDFEQQLRNLSALRSPSREFSATVSQLVCTDGAKVLSDQYCSSAEPETAGRSRTDCGIVQARQPIASFPDFASSTNYFEVTIINHDGGEIIIGLAPGPSRDGVVLQRGFGPRSIGLSSDGFWYSGGQIAGVGQKSFGVGDTIGCGYVSRTKHLFFTRNGKALPTSPLHKRFSEMYDTSKVHPTISLAVTQSQASGHNAVLVNLSGRGARTSPSIDFKYAKASRSSTSTPSSARERAGSTAPTPRTGMPRAPSYDKLLAQLEEERGREAIARKSRERELSSRELLLREREEALALSLPREQELLDLHRQQVQHYEKRIQELELERDNERARLSEQTADLQHRLMSVASRRPAAQAQVPQVMHEPSCSSLLSDANGTSPVAKLWRKGETPRTGPGEPQGSPDGLLRDAGQREAGGSGSRRSNGVSPSRTWTGDVFRVARRRVPDDAKTPRVDTSTQSALQLSPTRSLTNVGSPGLTGGVTLRPGKTSPHAAVVSDGRGGTGVRARRELFHGVVTWMTHEEECDNHKHVHADGLSSPFLSCRWALSDGDSGVRHMRGDLHGDREVDRTESAPVSPFLSCKLALSAPPKSTHGSLKENQRVRLQCQASALPEDVTNSARVTKHGPALKQTEREGMVMAAMRWALLVGMAILVLLVVDEAARCALFHSSCHMESMLQSGRTLASTMAVAVSRLVGQACDMHDVMGLTVRWVWEGLGSSGVSGELAIEDKAEPVLQQMHL